MNGGFRLAATMFGAALVAGCGREPAPRQLPPPPPASRASPAQPTSQSAPSPLRPQRSWRAARVIADAPLLPAREVVVGPGETLDGIARFNGVGVGALAVANGLGPPFGLAPGMKITVPSGRWHIVKPGETGIAVARAYGREFARVARANGLRPPYALEVGDRLLIPPPPPRPRHSARFAVPPAPARPARAEPAVPPATVEARAQAYNLDIDQLLGKEPARRVRPRSPSVFRAPSPRGEESTFPPPLGEMAAKPTEGIGTVPTAPIVASIHLDWPLTGRLLSTFGAKPGGRFNDGVNIAADAGTPVRAAADGTIAYAGNGVAAFGGLVLVRHADGWLTAYAHCEALLVAKGDRVTRGQPIARVGSTGEVDAPQLHFEVRRGRTPVDPLRLLPAR